MRDYPNMSYCMCNNTLLALQQVLDAMEDGGLEFLQNLGEEELRAWQDLYHAAQAFVEQAEHLQEEFEDRMSDYDGQPDDAQEWHDFDPDC